VSANIHANALPGLADIVDLVLNRMIRTTTSTSILPYRTSEPYRIHSNASSV
jgi:hypothetical protein